MNHPGLDNEPATQTHCRHCAQPILQATTDGITIRTDTIPLDIPAELAAHLDQRATYQIHTRLGGQLELLPRNASRIRHQPAALVVADHRCPPGTPRLTWKQAVALPAPVPIDLRRTGNGVAGDHPPF